MDNEASIREAVRMPSGADDQELGLLVHPDYRDHVRPGLERGADSFRALRAALWEAFADI